MEVRDPRVRSFVNPTRLVWSSGVCVEDAEAMIQGAENACHLRRVNDSECACILLDFGRELHGGVRIDSPINSWHKPARLRVRFGESVSEAMNEPNNDHAVHDQEVLVPWMGYTEVGCTGFRFVRLDLLDVGVDVTLNSVKAVALYHDLEYVGSFECSDKRLNQIWNVGARTVHLCLQDYLWDGIKRDRLVWIGDIHSETRVVSSVFGELDLVNKSLDYARDQFSLPGWMNGIPSYSVWWIVTHHDWYMHHGNIAYLRGQRDYLLGLLEELMRCVGSDGRETLGGNRFLDWSTVGDSNAVSAGLQALLVLGLRVGAELCQVLGEDEAAARAKEKSDLAATWRGYSSRRKSSVALMVMAGTIDPKIANNSILSVDRCADMSTFYGYYVLKSMAKAGDFLGCLNLIRKYWGGMLDLGATTFWEHFDIDWIDTGGRIDELVPPGKCDIHKDCGDHCYKGLRHSLCHGWSAGPTAWLSEYVLGVSPVAPGFGATSITPHLGDLRWVRGAVPTPYGPIEVRHEQCDNGEVKSDVVLPIGVNLVDMSEGLLQSR